MSILHVKAINVNTSVCSFCGLEIDLSMSVNVCRYWEERMKIGILAELTGVSARMLRYYEDQGLLHPERLGNGYRDYPEASVTRVLQVRDLLTAGLSTQAIQEMVPCFVGSGTDFRPMVSPELAANLARELDQIERRIETLQRNGEAIRVYLAQARAADGRPVG